jgi:hypothetical protein
VSRLRLQMTPSFDEVDVYFEHLRAAELDTSAKGKEVLKILKAASFLVLYNVAEASVRLCVEEIATRISLEKVGSLRLAEPISCLAISERILKPLRDGQRPDATSKAVLALLTKAGTQECLGVPSNLPFGGNVDATQVREIAKVFGFQFTPPTSTEGGACLEKIKTHRNNLGHGTQRFGDCGNEYTVPDLVAMKTQFRDYLEALLDGVDEYLQERGYDLEVRLQSLVGPNLATRLVTALGSPLSVFRADEAALRKIPGIDQDSAAAIRKASLLVLV